MKKQKRLGTFLSGILAGAMLLGCGSAALAAAGGNVSFGTMGLKTISGKTVVNAGDYNVYYVQSSPLDGTTKTDVTISAVSFYKPE